MKVVHHIKHNNNDKSDKVLHEHHKSAAEQYWLEAPPATISQILKSNHKALA